jgi:hypothetical protein
MSLGPLLARISQIETAIADPGALLAGGSAAAVPSAATATPPTSAPTATTASAATSFASLLGSASAPATASSPQALSEAETLNSLYGMEALQSLSGDSSSAPGSSSVDPASQIMSLLGGGPSGQSAAATPTATLGSLTSPAAIGAVGGAGSSSLAGSQSIVQIAESQVGQVEQPFGSNDGPAISMYRTAVAGAGPGEPWCAQFASWVARQAGTPLGNEGQGFSSVADVWAWAQQTGRAIPNGPGVVPAPGDLIVFGDEHVGIVTAVQPNGDIDTVEGNYDNQVVNNVRGPNEATGYVNMSA